MGTETGGNPDGCKNKDIDDPDSGEDDFNSDNNDMVDYGYGMFSFGLPVFRRRDNVMML